MLTKIARALRALNEWRLARRIADLRQQAEDADLKADAHRAGAAWLREEADQIEMRLAGLQLRDSVIGELDEWPADVEHLEPRR